MELPPLSPRRVGRIQHSQAAIGSDRLRSLHCFDDVYERVVHGHTLSSIVEFVRDQGECLDIAPETLKAHLATFRSQLPKREFVNDKTLPTVNQRFIQEAEEGINVLEELGALFKIQQERIEIDFKNEKAINKLMKSTGREIREARELLLSIHRVQTDLGLVERHLGTTNFNINQNANVIVGGYGEDAQKVLQDPKKVNNVLGLFRRVVSLGHLDDGGVVDVDVDVESDGDNR